MQFKTEVQKDLEFKELAKDFDQAVKEFQKGIHGIIIKAYGLGYENGVNKLLERLPRYFSEGIEF